VIDVHPPKLDEAKATTISQASAQKPEWVKPTLDIPSEKPLFKNLSASIIKGENRVVPAAVAIKDYVTSIMRPNAGIGVLRDATEVLSSKEGVCRDYAILTTTLMRSAGIPARLASGVVNWQGDFYYHAWVEVWDGSMWIGIDSTVPQKQMSAAHVKLADGNVEDAFAFTFLDKVKIEVLDVRRG
jgi:transglutaminase-like putative cysteine protease